MVSLLLRVLEDDLARCTSKAGHLEGQKRFRLGFERRTPCRLTCPMTRIKDQVRQWIIPSKGEFRFEVAFDETIGLTLTSGQAEIYGTELACEHEYELSGVKMAVFSYEGAKVTVRGSCEVDYISEEVPTMPVYLNIHGALETLRQRAAQSNDEPPRVLLVGSSRHTVGQILSSYAVRSGKRPLVVDLDPTRGSLLFPGALTAQTLEEVVDIENGFPETPGRISYFYGHQASTENSKLYRKLVGRLAFAANARLASMEDPFKSGALMIAPTEINEHLQEIKELFKVSVILVIGNERLHSTIAKNHPDVSVLKAPLSGGVVQLDSTFRRSLSQKQFRAYFYGPRHEFTPFSVVLHFDDVHIRRLGESAVAPSSALPLGATRKVSETRTSKVEPTKGLLLYSIMGCSYATGGDEDQLSDANCAGFVYVTAVDESKKQMTVLSPCPGKLPSSYLILGSIKWIEN